MRTPHTSKRQSVSLTPETSQQIDDLAASWGDSIPMPASAVIRKAVQLAHESQEGAPRRFAAPQPDHTTTVHSEARSASLARRPPDRSHLNAQILARKTKNKTPL